ncbi:MAG TPA: hypothetical protein VIY09_07130, partial [Rhizomicrobium sp.]
MPHQQEFAIADDDGQQVVEIMRDAAGELANRLHFLRLSEFGLQRLLLGNVDEIQHEAVRARAQMQFAEAIACGIQRKSCAAVCARLGERFSEPGPGRFRCEVGEQLTLYIRRCPEKFLEQRIRFDKHPIAMSDRHADRGVLEDGGLAGDLDRGVARRRFCGVRGRLARRDAWREPPCRAALGKRSHGSEQFISSGRFEYFFMRLPGARLPAQSVKR